MPPTETSHNMNTTITFDEVQVGDTVRCRSSSTDYIVAVVVDIDEASIYRAGRARSLTWLRLIGTRDDTFTLVSRPKPIVELPSLPTLGWLDSTGNDHALGIWVRGILGGERGITNVYGIGRSALAPEVTAFTKATAVPTEALDYLRAQWRGVSGTVAVFLHDVDAANGARK